MKKAPPKAKTLDVTAIEQASRQSEAVVDQTPPAPAKPVGERPKIVLPDPSVPEPVVAPTVELGRDDVAYHSDDKDRGNRYPWRKPSLRDRMNIHTGTRVSERIIAKIDFAFQYAQGSKNAFKARLLEDAIDDFLRDNIRILHERYPEGRIP